MASVVRSSALRSERALGLAWWRLCKGGHVQRFGARRPVGLWCGGCQSVMLLCGVVRLPAGSAFLVCCRGCGAGLILSRLPSGPDEPEAAAEPASPFAHLSMEELMAGAEKEAKEQWRHLHQTWLTETPGKPNGQDAAIRAGNREFRRIAKVPKYLLWC